MEKILLHIIRSTVFWERNHPTQIRYEHFPTAPTTRGCPNSSLCIRSSYLLCWPPEHFTRLPISTKYNDDSSVITWFSLSPEKTIATWFYHVYPDTKLQLYNHDINWADRAKYLGIRIDMECPHFLVSTTEH